MGVGGRSRPSSSVSTARADRVLAIVAAIAIIFGWAGLAATRVAVAIDLPPSQLGVNVYDFAGIWSDATESQAQAIADRIAARTGVQLAIVSWPSGLSSVDTGQAEIDAETIGNTWKVGRAGDQDGLVVLFDMDTSLRHGQVYLATNKGFKETYLSDSEAQSIIDGDFLPAAKDGDLDASLLNGLAHLDRVIQPGGNPERTLAAEIRLVVAIVVAAFGVVALLVFVRAWLRQGRDAEIPLIDDSVLLPEPPPDLTPAMATVLRRDLVTREAFSSALVDLGHRGLIRFDQQGKDAKDVDLVVNPRPLDDDASRTARERPLGVAETGLLAQIRLKAGGDDTLSHARLRSGVGVEIYKDFKKHIGIAAASQGWFRADPNQMVKRWTGTGVGVAIAAGVGFWLLDSVDHTGFVGSDLPQNTPLLSGAVIFVGLVGVAIAILGRYMAARTADGAQTLAMALAYRNTLRYEITNAHTVAAAVEATQRRLPWISTPDLLTVWAVALGLNTEIDKLIADSLLADEAAGRTAWAPVWYSSPGGFSSVVSGAGLAATVSSVGVSAASSGGSGYGGGGGFGGGGGGGGGGAGGGF